MDGLKIYKEHLLAFGDQFDPSRFRTARLEKLARSRQADAMVVVGMGGSGLAGDIVKMLAAEKVLPPITVWKDYGLPPTGLKDPFFVFCSFSGNTEETLSGLEALIRQKKKVNIGIVTAGGALARLAERHNLPVVSFDHRDLTPREGLGYTTTSLLTLLNARFPGRLHVGKRPVFARELASQGKALAKAIGRDVPFIYTDTEFKALGYFWKINFNETAKRPAFSNVIPEANHNEIEGFEQKFNLPFFAIFIEHKGIATRIKKRMALMRRELAQRGVRGIALTLPGKTREAEIWNGVSLSYWTSYFLAEHEKIDPRETKLIEDFKKKMRRG